MCYTYSSGLWNMLLCACVVSNMYTFVLQRQRVVHYMWTSAEVWRTGVNAPVNLLLPILVTHSTSAFLFSSISVCYSKMIAVQINRKQPTCLAMWCNFNWVVSWLSVRSEASPIRSVSWRTWTKKVSFGPGSKTFMSHFLKSGGSVSDLSNEAF